MSAIATLHGLVRQASPKFVRASGEQFGTEYAILSDADGVLGETVKVLMFNAREGDPANPVVAEGSTVDWIVEFEANDRFGLQAQFKKVAGSSPSTLVGVPADVETSRK